MRLAPARTIAPRTATYLRCYPEDCWQMRAHRDLLDRHAAGLGLPAPVVFIDNGFRSSGALPRLEELLAQTAAGAFRVVLIPGAWVFSLDAVRAATLRGRFEAHGCQVLEPASARERSVRR